MNMNLFSFRDGKIVFPEALRDYLIEKIPGDAFQTVGCPGCNRPYYNERPSGPLYNYPRDLTMEELNNEKEMIKRLIQND